MVNTTENINGRPREENLVPIMNLSLVMKTSKKHIIVYVPLSVTDEIGDELLLIRKDPTIELISMTKKKKTRGKLYNSLYRFDFSNTGLPFKKRSCQVQDIPCIVHKLKNHPSGKIVFHERNAMNLLNK